MAENTYLHVQRLFNSLYSYFKIPLQMKNGRNLIVETQNIPAGFSFSKYTGNSLYTVDTGDMKITVSSAGEIFVDLYLEDRKWHVISCRCQLIDIAPLKQSSLEPNRIIPLCTIAEFTAFCTLLYNYFAWEPSDDIPSYLASVIYSIFNNDDSHVHQTETNRNEDAEEYTSSYDIMKYDWIKLEHVRSGSVKDLTKLLNSEKYVYLTQTFFTSVSVIQESIDYTMPLRIQFVHQIGGNIEKAMTVYWKYKNAKSAIKDIAHGTELYNAMLVDFCSLIGSTLKKRYSPKVNECMLYIHNNWKNKINIDDMCISMDVSRAYLMKLFKKETGQTIGDYVTDIRINYIKYMLVYTKESVSYIAAEAGYSNQSYMTTVFKSKIGMTPLEYQKKHFTTIFLESPTG